MKKILYLDAFAGVSGDMFVGALLDLGVDLEAVLRDVAGLGLPGVEIRAGRVARQGIMGTKFDVIDPATGRSIDELPLHHGGHHEHHHEHYPHGHDHHLHHEGSHHDRAVHHHGDDGDHEERHGNHEHRSLCEIRRLIAGSALSPEVAADAVAVFEILGRAEASVHGVGIEEVHFHEVGALDTIVDVVAAASAFRLLGVDEAVCSPVHVGTGMIRCAHGLLPVPAPATLEILKGIPVYATDVTGELATPTGAALLRHYCRRFGPLPSLTAERVGYGAGTRERAIPNLLRATIGTREE